METERRSSETDRCVCLPTGFNCRVCWDKRFLKRQGCVRDCRGNWGRF